ncbi:hypothetical protein Lesp02_75290 [Lentzea sp. NBRC 105346]|uniref:ATP-grasp domain-containing protein n=1 Tax=Lentzea sp. NBRC 105346 TaxID=3032205 RepID=UPI0024A4D14F|nr:hypothetical protein [Lentzea sp. NBRC 105346]GLZ35342.1 hypothetical protein Lesp02_75290 [Lentzea sp. NBRC 105346]
MGDGSIVLITDHSSTEGSADVLAAAVRRLTGRTPVHVDARHFLPGNDGKVGGENGELRLSAAGEEVTPDAVIVYEIPPHGRRAFEPFQRELWRHGIRSHATEAWRWATEKDLMVRRFVRDGVPHMPTRCGPWRDAAHLCGDFEELGGDVWLRPAVGAGGDDVFRVTAVEDLVQVAGARGTWLMSKDAANVNADGLRHQFRVVVLGGEVVRVCEHVQKDEFATCNEVRGAVSTVLDPGELPEHLAELAVRAARSVGLSFAGVDLAAEHGGVVFEVNVHPAFGADRGLETMAIPYVREQITPRSGRRRRGSCRP